MRNCLSVSRAPRDEYLQEFFFSFFVQDFCERIVGEGGIRVAVFLGDFFCNFFWGEKRGCGEVDEREGLGGGCGDEGDGVMQLCGAGMASGRSAHAISIHLRFLHSVGVFLDSIRAYLFCEEIGYFPIPMGFGSVRCLHRSLRSHALHQLVDLQCAHASRGGCIDSGQNLHGRGFMCDGAHAGTYYPGLA